LEPTDAQKKYLAMYWNKAMLKFGLPQYVTKFKFPQGKKEYFAEIGFGYNEVTVRFSQKFWNADPSVKRHTIVHEILHIWVNPLVTAVSQLCSGWIPPNIWTRDQAILTEHEEQLVDALGRVLQEMLPVWKD